MFRQLPGSINIISTRTPGAPYNTVRDNGGESSKSPESMRGNPKRDKCCPEPVLVLMITIKGDFRVANHHGNPRGLDHEPKDDAEGTAVLGHGIQPEGCLHPRHPSRERIKDYKNDESSG